MPKYWMSSHQRDFKSCFSFRLHVLAAKGKYQEIDFGKKPKDPPFPHPQYFKLKQLLKYYLHSPYLSEFSQVSENMHPPHNIQYSGSKVYWKKGNLNLQISPDTDRRHLFLYFFLIKQPSIHFILQHQSGISTPIKRTNCGEEGGENDQINYWSTEFILFPDADGSLNSFSKGISYSFYIEQITKCIYLIELGKPSLQNVFKTASIPKTLIKY